MKLAHYTLIAMSLSLAACATTDAQGNPIEGNPYVVSGFEYKSVKMEESFPSVSVGDTASLSATCGIGWYVTGGSYAIEGDRPDFNIQSAGVSFPVIEDSWTDGTLINDPALVDINGCPLTNCSTADPALYNTPGFETEVGLETLYQDNGSYELTLRNNSLRTQSVDLSVTAVCIKF